MAATLMLEDGADIGDILAFLGHEDLENTWVYCRVPVAQLQAILTRTHPGPPASARPVTCPPPEVQGLDRILSDDDETDN